MFVQVIHGRVSDADGLRRQARLRALEEGFMPTLRERWPDLIGAVRAWDGDHFTQAVYFTSEAEAREGESKMAAEAGDDFERYGSLLEDVAYLDLRDPWLCSA